MTRTSSALLILASLVALGGCGGAGNGGSDPEVNNDAPNNDPNNAPNNDVDGEPDAGDPNNDPGPVDAGDGDGGEPDADEQPEEDADQPDVEDKPDADAPGECLRVAVDGEWFLEVADDVSIGFRSGIDPDLPGNFNHLLLLFERYQPGPDVGVFALGGEGPDGNYGTCAHCVVMPGPDPQRAWFADGGTLETRADPYGQRLDAVVTGLRLVEVEVSLETRTSTPVPGGRCVEVEDFTVSEVFPSAGWRCPQAFFDDGELCHCQCGAFDPDCARGTNCAPLDPNCVPDLTPPPTAECTETQICAFDPEITTTTCTETCDWAGRVGCAQGACVYSTGGDPEDTCITSVARLEDATIGEPCLPNGYQRYCNIEEGFAMGYCGPNDVCRALCDSDAQCNEPGHTCRRFLVDEGLGYCGPEPEDG